ncbi:hypothetical protein Lalb_Chr01g0023391 [Lupinus albus]|uniref:Knottin, scorpion toxin n=1 Tax=Lupinus albus TaxID=3870 RepID=A0A6A4R9S7_LUPAL|nr:hypothetical protein Lalb_Chr01g0023391 [Lupinus albus]
MFCIALVLAAGPVVIGTYFPLNCIGSCAEYKDCNSNCIKMGHKYGGVCTAEICCCLGN